MGITLKRETIMTWDALPVRMKLLTPAQQVLIAKNRSTGHCFSLWTLLLSCNETWVIVLSWDKNQTPWTMSSTTVMTHLLHQRGPWHNHYQASPTDVSW